MNTFEQQCMDSLESSRERSKEVIERARKFLRSEREYRAQVQDMLVREQRRAS